MFAWTQAQAATNAFSIVWTDGIWETKPFKTFFTKNLATKSINHYQDVPLPFSTFCHIYVLHHQMVRWSSRWWDVCERKYFYVMVCTNITFCQCFIYCLCQKCFFYQTLWSHVITSPLAQWLKPCALQITNFINKIGKTQYVWALRQKHFWGPSWVILIVPLSNHINCSYTSALSWAVFKYA